MESLTFSVKDIEIILGLITMIWAVYQITIKVAEPRKALEKQVETLEMWHKEDHKRIKEMEDLMQDIFRCVYQLVRHEATGNGTEDFVSLLKDLDRKVKY